MMKRVIISILMLVLGLGVYGQIRSEQHDDIQSVSRDMAVVDVEDLGFGEDTEPEIVELGFGEDTEPEIVELGFGEDTEPEIVELGFGEDTEPEIVEL
jgi:hypothetical protein